MKLRTDSIPFFKKLLRHIKNCFICYKQKLGFKKKKINGNLQLGLLTVSIKRNNHSIKCSRKQKYNPSNPNKHL